MTEDEDNVELDGSPGFYYAMTGDAVPLINKWEMHLSE